MIGSVRCFISSSGVTFSTLDNVVIEEGDDPDVDETIRTIRRVEENGTEEEIDLLLDLTDGFEGPPLDLAELVIDSFPEIFEQDEPDEEVLDMGYAQDLIEAVAKGANAKELVEKTVVKIRAGKKVKVKVPMRKKRMSPKQKAALAKARRTSHSSGALRARAKSMAIRKRAGM